MTLSDKSLERMPSSENSVQLPSTERTITTLVLDVLERLTILEQSFKFADLQRNKIAEEVTRLGTICAVKSDLEKVVKLVDEHEEVFRQFKFGLRVARAGWAAIYVTGGGLVGAGFQWFLYNH